VQRHGRPLGSGLLLLSLLQLLLLVLLVGLQARCQQVLRWALQGTQQHGWGAAWDVCCWRGGPPLLLMLHV
jgi:hypothetical protein